MINADLMDALTPLYFHGVSLPVGNVEEILDRLVKHEALSE